jgi:hypothetical protein
MYYLEEIQGFIVSILLSEKVLHKDYDRKNLAEKTSSCDPQGAWRQDGLIGGKPPVIK